METKNKKEIIAFTDGSSRGNPGPGGWGAVLIFPEREGIKVAEKGGAERLTTNNRMEMTAVIEVLKYTEFFYSKETSYPVTVYTDSSYLIKGITGWVFLWEKNDWKKNDGEPVKNEDLWRKLISLKKKMNISWVHVKGHSGVPGNERADEIACSFADGKDANLREVEYKDYGIDILSLKQSSTSSQKEKKSFKKAYSYVSEVAGDVMSHKSWDECKNRVEGARGARFKKVYSLEEEIELMKEWLR